MKFKLPIEAFESCPGCKSSDGIKALSFAVYCTNCGWDSSSVSVESGAMDALINQYERYLERQEDRRAKKRKARAVAKTKRKTLQEAKAKCAA